MADYIGKNHLQEYVTILPETDDMSHLLSTMDIGIVPSKSEAFGRVTVEYMLQNLAVIVNDSGANCEIVQDGISGMVYKQGAHVALANKMEELIVDNESGFLVDKGDHVQLAEMLDRIYEMTYEDRCRISKAAHERAKLFSIDEYVRNLDALISDPNSGK